MRAAPAGVAAICAFLLFVPLAQAADDVISVAPVVYAAPGASVEIPIYVRDVSGTPVGEDVGKPIRFFEFTIEFSNAEYISGCSNQTFPACQVSFRTAGVLAAFVHAANPITFVSSQSIFVRRVAGKSVNWRLDGPEPGDLIGYLEMTLDPDVQPGSELTLSFDPAPDATRLGDQQLTVSEAAGNGLQMTGGRVVVVDCAIPPNPEELDFEWLGNDTRCKKLSGGCRSGETIIFSAESTDNTFGPCETVAWNFGDGSATRIGLKADHVFTPGTYEVTMGVSTRSGQTEIRRTIVISDPCTLPPLPSQVFRYEGPTSNCSGIGTKCGIGENVQFTFLGDDAIASCRTVVWTFGDGTLPVTGTEVDHAYSVAGTYTVTAHISTAGGETGTSRQIHVAPQIACTATAPVAVVVNAPAIFTATTAVPGVGYQWFFGAGSTANTAIAETVFTRSGPAAWLLLVSHEDYASCRKRGTLDVQGLPKRRTVRP